MSTSTKTKTRSQLVKQLDSVFSQFIRLRYAVDGYSSCVTCGATKSWKEQQCGHFFTRGRYATRWDEDNCQVQDYRCNVALNGNYINYTKYMIDNFGREFVDALEAKSLGTVKIPTYEINEKITYYADRVKELLSQQ